jgi:alpha-galactosidase
MLPTKIVVIGAGSAIFGLNTLGSLLYSSRLRGSHVALVDRNSQSLEIMALLAERLNREWGAGMSITTHSTHREALDGAGFVVLSIEVPPREALWRSDYEIPLKYGVRQPYAENGGPGGFAHAARNIGPVLEIAQDMQRLCPDAWLINFTNPLMRICDAVSRYTQVKVVGLCHQIRVGYAMVAKALAHELDLDIPEGFTSTHASMRFIPYYHDVARQALEKVHITAAGLNHFTWMLDLRRGDTGENLYPLFARRWRELPENFEPLTRQVYDIFGLFPIPGDEHLCEYLPWMSDPLTRPWEKFDLSLYEWDFWTGNRSTDLERVRRMGSGEMDLDGLLEMDSEGALEIIEGIAGGSGTAYHALAVNLHNRGFIPNLPEGAIVEVPGLVSMAGITGVEVSPLPAAIAELCRREISAVQLCVDAAVHGDRQAALQCLLLDPVIRDIDTAQSILEDYLSAYRDVLPQFWTN